MMNKKSQGGIPYLVKLAAIAIVLLAFILIIPSFKNLLYGAVKTGECQWDLLFSALMTQMSLGKMNIPPECKAEYINVTKADLEEYLNEAAVRIHMYEQRPDKYRLMREAGFKDYKDIDEAYHAQMEWALNNFVADKMLWCWDRVWRGSLPIFDYWYNVVDWTFFGLREGDYDKDELERLDEEDKTQLFEVHGPPTFCIVCARLKFDKEVQGMFPDPIKSLNTWMSYNPAPNSEKSYMAELLEGQTFSSKIHLPKYEYSVQEPLAITYKRINPHVSKKTLSWAGDLLGITEETKTINILALSEYDKVVVSMHQGGESCFFVID